MYRNLVRGCRTPKQNGNMQTAAIKHLECPVIAQPNFVDFIKQSVFSLDLFSRKTVKKTGYVLYTVYLDSGHGRQV